MTVSVLRWLPTLCALFLLLHMVRCFDSILDKSLEDNHSVKKIRNETDGGKRLLFDELFGLAGGQSDDDSVDESLRNCSCRKYGSPQNVLLPLLYGASSDPSGRIGTVVGWGRTSEGGMLPALVQEVQVPILSLQQCRQMKYRPQRITQNMVCAGKGTQDSCQGDSGGPLLVNSADDKLEIVGIVSWGVGCGRPGYPGVYTRVSRYSDWVKRNMKDSCFCIN
ncbi:hypothetical protein C0J52_00495 [Blattella germanica]|nr:hypothetical protein C0J52_00495 [Blattella germanica]